MGGGAELAHFGGLQRVRQMVGLLQVAREQQVAEQGAFPVLGQELVDQPLQLGAVLAQRPGDVGAGAQGDVLADVDCIEHLRPERRLVGVHQHGGDEAGLHHLQQPFVLDVLVRGQDLHRRLALGLQPLVQGGQALVVAAGGAHVDPLSGKVLHGRHGRAGRPGDQDFADVAPNGNGEVHLPPAGGGDGEVGHRQVPVAGGERRQQLVPGDRNEHQADLQGAGAQPVVQELLERLEHLVGQAPLHGPVEKVERPAGRHQGAHDAPLGNAVKVVEVRFADQSQVIQGQGRLWANRRRG